jgi:DNA-binding NarL/FixJ family response regulator
MTLTSTPIKVFLADDSTMICERVAAMLVKGGMVVVGQAGAPETCIEGIVRSRPNVVVLDVQLLGGTGLQVLRQVRAADPNIAFVVFTNNAGPAYRKRYSLEGADRFLDKSSEFEQLVDAVKRASRRTH